MKNYDVFVCHASEDKVSAARPVSGRLRAMGYRVWYDEFSLKVGDSLRQSIDRGLAESRFGIVVLSSAFFAKRWTQYELDGLVAREMQQADPLVLPIWHGVTQGDVAAYSPALADKVAIVSTLPLPTICEQLTSVIGLPAGPKASPIYAESILAQVPSHLRPIHAVVGMTAPWEEEPCPRCGQLGQTCGYDGSDGDEAAWFECHHCGLFEPR